MRNIDRIRQMTTDELVEFLEEFLVLDCSMCSHAFGSTDCHERNCKQGVKQWLEQESEE